MSKTPYCKMCDKYHYERSTFYDIDISETVYFCSENHKNEYLNKKRDPNYKTSQDKFMDEMNEKRENQKAERHRKLKDIEDYYAKNPDGDYNNQSLNQNSSNHKSSKSFKYETLPSIYRSKDSKVVFGFCGGLAHKFRVNVIFIRIAVMFSFCFYIGWLYFLTFLIPAYNTKE